jgi:CHAT domain-containing protein
VLDPGSPGRLRSRVTAFLLLCVLAAPLGADEKDRPTYIDRVLAAARAGNDEGLRALAADVPGDPWVVVDRLASSGLGAAAPVFAAAVDSRDRGALESYAKSLPLEVPAARRAFSAALALQGRNEVELAVATLRTAAFPERSVGAVRCGVQLGSALTDLGQRDVAEAAYASAAATARSLGWLAGEHAALVGRQWLLEEAARYADMRAVLQRRREIQVRRNSRADLAEIDRELGGVHVAVGTPRRALEPLARAIAYHEAENQPVQGAYARLHLALAHSMRGAFARALSLAEEAERACLEAGEPDGVDYAGYVQLVLLLEIGKTHSAVRLGARLLEGERKREPGQEIAVRLHYVTALAREGRFDEALPQLEHCLALCREHGLPEVASALLHRGLSIRYEQGRYAEALGDCVAAESLAARMSPEAAYAAWGKGLAAIHLPARAEAEGYLNRALALAVEREDADLSAMTHGALAELYLAQGELDAVIEQCHLASKAMDLASAGLSDDEAIVLRSSRERRKVFGYWVQAALRLGGTADLYEAIESGRSRALLAALGGAQAARGLDLPPALADQEADVLADVREQRARYALMRDEGAELAVLRTQKGALQESLDQYLAVAGKIQRVQGRRAGLAGARPVPITALMKQLPSDAAFALFAITPRGAVALVVLSTGARVVRLEGWEALQVAAGRYTSLDRSATEASLTAARRELAAGLIDALELPEGVRTLYVSPDGALSALPWPAVAEMASRRTDVTLLPSASTLLVVGSQDDFGPGRKLALGDPVYETEVGGRSVPWFARGRDLPRLEHSADEVRGITGPQDRVLLRGDASETAVKRELATPSSWDVVHFACHGVMDRDAPSLSSLALTPTETDDGFLTAVEIFQMHVRARLVVLAACDMGRGKLIAGEGVLGIARAFLAAGARRLLVSVWPADDRATTVLMKRFYEERAKSGVGDDEALRRAQHFVRRVEADGTRPWSHPYYWAGWVFWGDAR